MKNDYNHTEKKPGCGRRVTRRKFLKTMGSGAAIAAASDALTVRRTAEAEVIKPETIVRMNLSINGLRRSFVVESRWSLLYILREKLGLSGTKVGCERGECGACTVLIDEVPRYACLTLAVEVQESEIVTLEGLMTEKDSVRSSRPLPSMMPFSAAIVPRGRSCRPRDCCAATRHRNRTKFVGQ
jgi:xanthine dehydrogenase YagT iron-sulfur-binding subunit